jgi:hypothetical protein
MPYATTLTRFHNVAKCCCEILSRCYQKSPYFDNIIHAHKSAVWLIFYSELRTCYGQNAICKVNVPTHLLSAQPILHTIGALPYLQLRIYYLLFRRSVCIMSHTQSIFRTISTKRRARALNGCRIAHDCVQLYGYTVI